MIKRHRRIRFGLELLGVLAAAACHDPSRPPETAAPTHLAISASVVGTPIETLVATVAAPDIPVSIVKNLPVHNGTASGTLVIPPGLARTITVTAFDDAGQVSHEGTRTVDVQRGQNATVSIPMLPRAGHVPITVHLGTVMISLSRTSAELQVGSALQLVATIVTADGDPVDEDPEWATTAPAIASVSRDGLVTGLREGTAQIIATYAGVAAIALIEVVKASGDPP